MKKSVLTTLMVSAGMLLSGCGIVQDHTEYEIDSPSDTSEIRHYKHICLNQSNGAACEYVATKGTYLSDEMKYKYLNLGCNYGYEKACKELSFTYPVLKKKCDVNNDAQSCYELGKRYASVDRHNLDLEDSLIHSCRELNHGDSCSLLASLYFDYKAKYAKEGDGFYYSSYLQKSNDYAYLGCKLNNAHSCYLQGISFGELTVDAAKNGSKEFNEDRTSKLYELYKKACDLGDQTGCDSVKIMNFIKEHSEEELVNRMVKNL